MVRIKKMTIIGNERQIKDMIDILAESEVACVIKLECKHDCEYYSYDCRKCIKDNITFIEIEKKYTDTDIEHTNKIIRDYIKTVLYLSYR